MGMKSAGNKMEKRESGKCRDEEVSDMERRYVRLSKEKKLERWE